MRYDYNSELECFVREDGLGKKIWINSSEAQRILTLRDLGYSNARICSKMKFCSDKVYESTVQNFLRNVDEGNIVVSDDYPAPRHQVFELTMEERVSRLEEDFEEFRKMIENPAPRKSVSDKVKSWMVW